MCHCNQCGYSWKPRPSTNGDPRACPSCKRYDWKESKKGLGGEASEGSSVPVRHLVDGGITQRGRAQTAVQIGQREEDSKVVQVHPTPPDFDDEELTGDEPAKPICGAETWNEQDGENYRCTLAPHGPKVKHGCWRKI